MVRRPAGMILALALALALGVAGCGGGGGGESDPGPAPAPSSAPAGSPAPVTPAQAAHSRDWPVFGGGPGRSSVSSAPTGISASRVARLRRRQITLPGTVDSSPLYLRSVRVRGKRRAVVVVTTTYGRTLALAAGSGKVLWHYAPPGIGRWEGSSQVTTATPVADPGRGSVYAAAPDGRIHKLRLSDGREIRTGRWPVAVTRDPTHEKLPSALNLFDGYVLLTTGGYIGDAPPYQAHVVALSSRTGRIVGVWNSLCAERHAIQDPPTCPESGAAMWGRAGAVVDARRREILVATGDGRWDGRRLWGDTVAVLSFPGLKLERAWTPRDQKRFEDEDVDLGSSAPALLPGDLVLQGGKAGQLTLLDGRRPNGQTSTPVPRTGGELQTLPTPGSDQTIAAFAVWARARLVFVTTNSGTAAYRLRGRRLSVAWENDTGGTSPVLAGGLLYVYDPDGGLVVYRPRSGRRVTRLPAGRGHWNSPVIAGGRIWLPEGDSNDHAKTGTLSLYGP